jgi:hypothetical protein
MSTMLLNLKRSIPILHEVRLSQPRPQGQML